MAGVRFTVATIRRRLARKDDPWSDIGAHAARAATARRKLDTVIS